MKEDTKRWRDFACTWVARINTVKNGHFIKSNLHIQCNPNQNNRLFLHRHRKIVSHIIWRLKSPRVAKATLITKKTVSTIPYFKLYYRAILTKVAWHCHKNRQVYGLTSWIFNSIDQHVHFHDNTVLFLLLQFIIQFEIWNSEASRSSFL